MNSNGIINGNLARSAGKARIAKPALTWIVAALSAAGAVVAIHKGILEPLQDTIAGPVHLGALPSEPRHISATAELWQQFAAARAKAITRQNSSAAANCDLSWASWPAPCPVSSEPIAPKGGVE